MRTVDLNPDELECPARKESVNVRRPLGVEVTILEEPSTTSLPAGVRPRDLSEGRLAARRYAVQLTRTARLAS